MGHRLLISGHLKHFSELVVVRVLPCGFAGSLIYPVNHTILDILGEPWRQRLFLEGCEDPQDVFIRGWIHTQIAHVLLQVWFYSIRTIQDSIHNGLLVCSLLQCHLDLISGDAKGPPWSLIEEAHVSVLLALYDRQELIPNLRNVGVPFKHREIFRRGTLWKVHNLKFWTKCPLSRHENYLVFLPFDDDLESYGDVVLAFNFVL
mmetsp:Transcript_45210/g.71844  ORF Transcript_45210/g.71844 Transcript_45210/m.71844 type:complete len:204 (-) Transcript_45210:190-801(-)